MNPPPPISVSRVHSLPKKTQPTRSHSTLSTQPKSTPSQLLLNYNASEPAMVCPEISEFRTGKWCSQEALYIRNYNIDYGHLERPDYSNQLWREKIVRFKEEVEEVGVNRNEHLETKRLTGISLCNESELQSRETEKKRVIKNVYLNLNTLDTCQQSSLKANKSAEVLFESNPTSSSKSSTRKGRVRLQEVKAYQLSRSKEKKESGQKRKLHSRIVKMVVGGGTPKTKIICYPDTSEYEPLFPQK